MHIVNIKTGELDSWVKENIRAIDAWVARQQSGSRPDYNKMLISIAGVLSSIYQQIININNSRQVSEKSKENIIAKANDLYDRLDYIKHPVAKKMKKLLFDVKRSEMWKFISSEQIAYIKELVDNQIK